MQPNSGVLVLPKTTAPALRMRATSVESAATGGESRRCIAPRVVTNPAASAKSLTPIGMPASGPTSSPASSRSSMAAACERALSASSATNALSCGFSTSIRSSACSVTAAALSVRSRTIAASASTVTVRKSGTSMAASRCAAQFPSPRDTSDQPEPTPPQRLFQRDDAPPSMGAVVARELDAVGAVGVAADVSMPHRPHDDRRLDGHARRPRLQCRRHRVGDPDVHAGHVERHFTHSVIFLIMSQN